MRLWRSEMNYRLLTELGGGRKRAGGDRRRFGDRCETATSLHTAEISANRHSETISALCIERIIEVMEQRGQVR